MYACIFFLLLMNFSFSFRKGCKYTFSFLPHFILSHGEDFAETLLFYLLFLYPKQILVSSSLYFFQIGLLEIPVMNCIHSVTARRLGKCFFNETWCTLLGLPLFLYITKEIEKNKSMECFKKHVSLIF